MLTADGVRDLLDYDPETGVFRWKVATAQRTKIGDVAGSEHPYGYVKISIYRRHYMAHRLAWLYVYGEWPRNDIDHMNGIRHDNRISNLRDVTRLVNNQGYRSRLPGETGYRGVYRTKYGKPYMARINSNKRPIHLGVFDTAEEAYAAYLKAKSEHHARITKDHT